MHGMYHIDLFSVCTKTNSGPRRFCEMCMKRVACSFFPYTSFPHTTQTIELLIPNLVPNIAFLSWPCNSVTPHLATPIKTPSTIPIFSSNPVVLTYFLNLVCLWYFHSDLDHPLNRHCFLCCLQCSF